MALRNFFDTYVFRSAVMLVLGVHVILTLIYCFPSNPIKLATWPLLEATIGTYFPQNWLLFAPEPIQADQAILVHCLAEPISSGGDLPNAGWEDITTPLIERHHANRFAAYERLSRSGATLAREWLRGPPDAVELHRECEAGDPDACTAELEKVGAARKNITPHLRKLASSFCLETRPAEQIAYVAVRLRQTGVLPWSKRRGSDPATPVDQDLGLFPIDGSVATSGLYAGRQR